ncbi:uncharacterized protein CC84DRAFT_1214733 [Paraphaeosphaeria sporulosa]|uniref:Uncharacterized protein n=1 Tax=Paraphaeosphaeria sporulosa TaxID=1460663 RepID=A0A177CN25_9PLEO|nr:uncharacterized protein CC84DRAFT_1214733 [Paraphaeosphaeria sporulosa]OAG08209.1 hypothetical protein CC84DRAFT_1214733 [Paraphaeosphaeria sporulosa]
MAAAEAPQAASPIDNYDEAKCLAALAQLEHLKHQLDDLRLTLPRILEPFHMPSKPPMFHAFKDNLIKAQRDMKTFKSQWQGQETQNILEHARKSVAADPDLSAGAQIQQYGWIEKETKQNDAAKNNGDGEERPDDLGIRITNEERDSIVGQWRQTHPTIKIEEVDDGKQLLIPFVGDSTKYRFRVTISEGATSPQAIQAECEGAGEPFTSVTRCLASRPNPNDLKHLLDMIAAYKTVKGLQCAKCKKMLDDDTTKPIARRCRQATGASETSETVWEPFHEGCLV